MEIATGISIAPTAWSAFRAFTPLKSKLSWRIKKKSEIGKLGKYFNLLDTTPYSLMLLVHIVAFLIFLFYILFKAAVFGADGLGPLAALFEFADKNILYIYALYGVFSVIDFFDGPTKLIMWVGSLIPCIKNSMGWANASRHLKLKEHAHAICLCNETHLNEECNKLLNSIIASQDNPNRAIRPDGLDHETAANILFVGHIIEGNLYSQKEYPSETAWTHFYREMSNIASEDDKIFSSGFIVSKNWSDDSFSELLLGKADSEGRLHPLLQNELLKQTIDSSILVLTNSFAGNSLGFADGIFGQSLKNFSKSIEKFEYLKSKGIQRQYKKLAVVWNLYPDLQAPKEFKSPFNTGIARLLMQNGVLISSSERIRYDEPEFNVSYDIALNEYVTRTLKTLKASKTPALMAWLDAQKNIAKEVNANQDWFVAYRIDQHIYHLGKSTSESDWKVVKDNTELIRNKNG